MIAIITACGANFASVKFALERLGKTAILTVNPEEIKNASHVILPGVGTANAAMQQLKTLNLVEVIRNLTQPVLGICLGMQILHEYSQEGEVPCLNIIKGKVLPLKEIRGYPLPHMGWNQIKFNAAHPLLQDIKSESDVYFVHRYCVAVSEHTVAQTQYSQNFAAMVQYKNFYGTQFHPERSGKIGAKILENFLNVNF